MLFKEYNRLLLLLFLNIFFTTYKTESLSLEEEKLTKYKGNLFRLNKELNYTTVKDIRNLTRKRNKSN